MLQPYDIMPDKQLDPRFFVQADFKVDQLSHKFVDNLQAPGLWQLDPSDNNVIIFLFSTVSYMYNV